MKVSVSLSDEDVEFLDFYAERHQIPSRSAALQRAIRALRTTELTSAYESAWNEWDESTDSTVWDAAATDGLPA
jgi:Arc/MetJ-type ribon-helix-helix transcriptional regulator